MARCRSSSACSASSSSAASAASSEDSPLLIQNREWTTIALLVSSRRRLLEDPGGRLDTHSEKGLEACNRFLRSLERTAEELNLEPAPRDYREGFSVNYRGLFDGETRSYRVDMLEAGKSLDQHPVIWANGEEYELSDYAMRRSEALKDTWAELCAILDAWVSPSGSPKRPPQLERAKLVTALENLDYAWASFECAYITELMKVQERARRLVEQAADCERCLSELEQQHPKDVLLDMATYQVEKRALVACISRLNSVANNQRKGRDDLTVSILDAAVELLEQCEDEDGSGASGRGLLSAARTIAEQVVESFEELRDYLHEVQHHLDLLHPHLCKNPHLVSRLVRWEETWEIGARYVHNEDVLGAVCYLVSELRRARGAAPALAGMCESCDAELFLVLPRIVVLCLLADPSKAIELIRRLLPHRFEQRVVPVAPGTQRLTRSSSNPDLAPISDLSRVETVPCMSSDLQALTERFWRTEFLLARALGGRSGTGGSPRSNASSPRSGGAGGLRPSAWDALVARAVGGAGGAGAYAGLGEGEEAKVAIAAAEQLMNEVEGWSMELQRHSAEDWNECINVLVQCLTN